MKNSGPKTFGDSFRIVTAQDIGALLSNFKEIKKANIYELPRTNFALNIVIDLEHDLVSAGKKGQIQGEIIDKLPLGVNVEFKWQDINQSFKVGFRDRDLIDLVEKEIGKED